MFHFSGFGFAALWIQAEILGLHQGGFPIRTSPGYKACLRLPEAFRSLPRPSSPGIAKAFTYCPNLFDHQRRFKVLSGIICLLLAPNFPTMH
jgi:hypothetical protein